MSYELKISLLVIFTIMCCTWFLYFFIMFLVYNPIRYYIGKPKYRRNKEGYIEYFNYLRNTWEYVTQWDDKETERLIRLCTSHDNPVNITYNGPGRYKIYVDSNCSKKELKERFNFKTTKELYENIEEQINNEDIITSKVLQERLTYKIIKE